MENLPFEFYDNSKIRTLREGTLIRVINRLCDSPGGELDAVDCLCELLRRANISKSDLQAKYNDLVEQSLKAAREQKERADKAEQKARMYEASWERDTRALNKRCEDYEAETKSAKFMQGIAEAGMGYSIECRDEGISLLTRYKYLAEGTDCEDIFDATIKALKGEEGEESEPDHPLKKYSRHLAGCARNTRGSDCDCGLEEALERLK